MLLKIIREGLGRTVAFIDQVTRPTPMTRPPEVQRDVDAAVQPMALYQYFACPFCIKTRRAIHRLNLPIALRDAQNNPEHRAALATDGGKIQVPCLRIDEPSGTRWLYESSDIIAYLEKRFGANAPGGGMPDDSRTQHSEGQPSGCNRPRIKVRSGNKRKVRHATSAQSSDLVRGPPEAGDASPKPSPRDGRLADRSVLARRNDVRIGAGRPGRAARLSVHRERREDLL